MNRVHIIDGKAGAMNRAAIAQPRGVFEVKHGSLALSKCHSGQIY